MRERKADNEEGWPPGVLWLITEGTTDLCWSCLEKLLTLAPPGTVWSCCQDVSEVFHGLT